jgi:hypothetical protein
VLHVSFDLGLSSFNRNPAVELHAGLIDAAIAASDDIASARQPRAQLVIAEEKNRRVHEDER